MTHAHTDTDAAQSFLAQGIAAYRSGKGLEAFYLLTQAIQHDPQSEQTWIWLSAAVSSPAERLFCLQRALAVNPTNEAVVRGLQRMPTDVQPQSPFPARRNDQGQELCTFPGCKEGVSRAGHAWCYRHWKQFVGPAQSSQRQPSQRQSTGVSTKSSLEEIASKPSDRSFRERFPAQHRTTDGHLVRSKAEVLIDNWLYMAGVVHAYERQLPIEEDMYCDFYIPTGKVYIEYWGLERDEKYLARRREKLRLYEKYQFNVIELVDEHVKNLDDHLPKMLLKFGVRVQ